MKVLEQRDAELTLARDQVTSIQKSLHEKEAACADVRAEVDQLRSQLQVSFGVQEQVEQLQVQSEQLRRQHDHTLVKHRQKLQRAVRKNKQLDMDLSARSSELERRSEEVKLLQSRLSSTSASERSSTEQLRAVRAHNAALSDKCHILQQQLDKSESQCSLLYRQLDEAQALHRSQICRLEEKLEEARHSGVSSLDQVKLSLEKQQDATRRVSEDNLRYRQQLADAASQLQLSEEQKVAAQQDYDLSQRQLKSSEMENERKKQRISELESALQSKNDVIRAFEDCEQRSVSVEVTRLQHKLEHTNKELVQVGHTERHLREKMYHYQQRVDSLQAECSSVRAQLKQALGELASWQQQCATLQHETSTAVKANDTSMREVANIREELRQTQTHLTDSELKVTHQEQQLCEVHLRLTKATELQLSTQAQLKLANSQLDKLRVENAKLMQSLHLPVSEPMFLHEKMSTVENICLQPPAAQLLDMDRSDQGTITSVSSLGSVGSRTTQANSPKKSALLSLPPHQPLSTASCVNVVTQSTNTLPSELSDRQTQPALTTSAHHPSLTTHGDLVEQITNQLSGVLRQSSGNVNVSSFIQSQSSVKSTLRSELSSTAGIESSSRPDLLRDDSASLGAFSTMQRHPPLPATTSACSLPMGKLADGRAGITEAGGKRTVSAPAPVALQPSTWLTSSGSSLSSLTTSSASQHPVQTQHAPLELSSALTGEPPTSMSSDTLSSEVSLTKNLAAPQFLATSSAPAAASDLSTFSLTETLEDFLTAEGPAISARIGQAMDRVTWTS